ncbi:MAG TPA: cyclase family protein [Candidatus Dormibacteraeota bacterium]|nr:cyclase family protein [Candidatus Dormibacteraeota bacterium]
MSDGNGEARLREAARRYCNWGRWGPEDQVGALNYITPDLVQSAAGLIRRGAVFSLAITFGASGPQTGRLGRFNPMLFCLRDGADTYAGMLDTGLQGSGYSDDVIMLPTHGATHWDALAHVHFESRMWNGYDCREVTSFGARRNDITTYRDRIVGRAVLLDLPRWLGVDWCQPGQAIEGHDLDACAAAQNVEVRRGDIVLLRFGHIAMCRARGSWGDYAGGDAPGLGFDSLGWLYERQVAGVASDTWGVEVRPNQITCVNQPWHRVAIPRSGCWWARSSTWRP